MSTGYAQYLSELRLNPLGGLVKVGTSGLAVVGAGSYSRPFNIDSENANTEWKAANTTNGWLVRNNIGWSGGNDNATTCGIEIVFASSSLDSEWQPFSIFLRVASCQTNAASTAAAWYYYRSRVYGASGFSNALVDSGGDTSSFTISFNDDGSVGTTFGMGTNNEARQMEIRITGPGARTTASAFVTGYSSIARFRRQP